jgi:hypothetical protein
MVTTATAGELQLDVWPVQFIPQEITEIPVVMDIGFFVAIDNQEDLRIKLRQVSINEYEGCTDVSLRTNFNLTLSCRITPTEVIDGEYSCSVSPADIDSPGGTASVCAKLENADLVDVAGGTRDVKVATVTLLVVPR